MRECLEEFGLQLDIAELRLLGSCHAPAANADGRFLAGTDYEHPSADVSEPSAELDELRRLDLHGALPDDLAPLLTEWVLPALVDG